MRTDDWQCNYVDPVCGKPGDRYTVTEQTPSGTYKDWQVSCDDHRDAPTCEHGEVIEVVPGWDHRIENDVINQATGQVTS